MNMRLLPKEPIMLRDTSGQDRVIEPQNLFKRHRKIIIAVLAVVAVLLVLIVYLMRYSGAGRSVDRARVAIATVERGSFVRDIAADGQVVAAVSPTLYANALGTVTLKVHAGDTVVKGQVLAVVDSPDLTAKMSQEDAGLAGLRIDWQRATLEADHKLSQLRDAYEQAQVDLKTAQRERDRSRKAYELGSYSELQALKAEDSLEKARFAFEQAKSNYESQPKQNRFDVDSKKALLDRQQFLVADLKRQVDGLNVRSPVDGQVGQVQVADRASVAKDAPLLTVVDLSALEVEIKVTESLARDLRPAMSADLDGGGHHWQGSVSGVSPEVVAGQVTARLRFGDEKPAGLRQSQRLSVRIFIDRRDNVLMVERGAFVDQEGGGFAYVVHGNIAERHPVQLGAASIAKVEVLDGLAVGDQIVISGTDAFNGAQRVILSH
ncbi:MAG TPA: HlyD family efflux transporter periplasmic adaptor subunit [Steroidobacteraceae bacterium]|jgi:HlyD family secretion protein|nr:HlyD family efflux transporter periplasmic adaptor subunit [Steroidobacteraceae bacterium]